MRKKFSARAAALGMSGVLLTSALTGCTFGFASDPDDPNAVKEEEPIDMTTDTFQYDTSLSGTSIVIMNTKAEIQTALEEIAKVFEEKAGVHIEIMPVTDGDSPYTKVVSLYNSGNPPTLSILDTTDVIALAEEKAADLSNEAWTGEAEEYLTKINGKVYSFPLCIEGRGIIYNKSVIEDTLGTEFDPSEIKTQDDFAALLQSLRDNGMKNPISMAKEDWSLGAHQLQYIYETYDGTSDGAAEVINELKDGTLYLPDYSRMNEFLNAFDLLKEYNVAKGDPLGADYDEMAIDLADGKTAFWFNGNWAWPNHIISMDPADYPEEFAQYSDYLLGRSMLVKKATTIPVESIVRGYLTGSGKKTYDADGTVCGIKLPEGLTEASKLPEPIFTPSTKAELGDHDENISFERCCEIVGTDVATQLRDASLAIYKAAAEYAATRGIIIADTKFEFGFIDGKLTLIDECLTPDSSRFWPAEGYAEGEVQPSYDKQYVRDWLRANWNMQGEPPRIPAEVIEGTSNRYQEAFQIITGTKFEPKGV